MAENKPGIMIEESQIIKQKESSFETLVQHIQAVDDALQRDAQLVINRNVTTRAWLTGLYIVEYEQNGSDRAKYGTHLLQDLSKRLGGKSYGVSNLRNFRQFYLYYPDLKSVIGAYLNERFQIHHSASGELLLREIQHSVSGELSDGGVLQLLTDQFASVSEIPVAQDVSKDGFVMILSSILIKCA